jgi:hypothetical protein
MLTRDRYPPTDEMFFVQNAGNPDAGTGLNKSSIVQKISLADAEALRKGNFSAEHVTVHTVPSNPQVINPNGEFHGLCCPWKGLTVVQARPTTRARSSSPARVRAIVSSRPSSS